MDDECEQLNRLLDTLAWERALDERTNLSDAVVALAETAQMQLTYKHHPLYTFVVDQQAGQTTGQGFKDFGGVWMVATVR